MLDLCGSWFLIDHIIAEIKAEQKKRGFRMYIAENLRMIGENTARAVNGGKYITAKWEEEQKQRDDRTGDEIAADIINRAGLKFTEGGD